MNITINYIKIVKSNFNKELELNCIQEYLWGAIRFITITQQ